MSLLDRIVGRKAPLWYGTEACRLALNDSRYSEDIVRMRNDPEVNRYISGAGLTLEDHEKWLESQLHRRDALNFAIVAHGRFAGTVSLYDIVPGVKCEYGRFVMPATSVRLHAPAAELLALSFAFEVLGVAEVYCHVYEGSEKVRRVRIKLGWKRDEKYDEPNREGNSEFDSLGYSIPFEAWTETLERYRDKLQLLLG